MDSFDRLLLSGWGWRNQAKDIKAFNVFGPVVCRMRLRSLPELNITALVLNMTYTPWPTCLSTVQLES
jgi:hypothetical protein